MNFQFYNFIIFKRLIFCAVLFSGFLVCQNAQAACAGSSPTWTTTPDYESVNSCISNALSGDTVQLTGGDATWTNQLLITHELILIGGSGTITTNVANDYAIKFVPTANEALEIKNFTFTGRRMIKLHNPSFSVVINKIKIHNNSFTLVERQRILQTSGGPIYGVFYNNNVQSDEYGEFFDMIGDGDLGGSWNQLVSKYGGNEDGSADNFYIEDNNFITKDLVTYGGQGGRYVFRYNTVTFNTGETQYGNEMHGDGGNYGCGTMVTEVYGNRFIHNAGLVLFDQRGGWHLDYYNYTNVINSTVLRIRDDFYGQTPDPCVHPNNPQPNYPSNSYYWANIKGNASIVATYIVEGAGIVENVNFWSQHSGTFNGSGDAGNGGGVGCGKLTDRPATCQTGVAYWATNQSCTDMTGMVGANPSTPITGTLYKCTATNIWTEYYTPYIYPHPLRTESGDTTPPAAPSGLSVS